MSNKIIEQGEDSAGLARKRADLRARARAAADAEIDRLDKALMAAALSACSYAGSVWALDLAAGSLDKSEALRWLGRQELAGHPMVHAMARMVADNARGLSGPELGFPEEGSYGKFENGVWSTGETTAAVCCLVDDGKGGSELHLSIKGTDPGSSPNKWMSRFNMVARYAVGLYPVIDSYAKRFDPLVDAAIDYASDPSHKVSAMVVSGHSLGGAAAENIVEKIADELGRNAPFDVRCATFGSPGTGNAMERALGKEARPDERVKAYAQAHIDHYRNVADPVPVAGSVLYQAQGAVHYLASPEAIQQKAKPYTLELGLGWIAKDLSKKALKNTLRGTAQVVAQVVDPVGLALALPGYAKTVAGEVVKASEEAVGLRGAAHASVGYFESVADRLAMLVAARSAEAGLNGESAPIPPNFARLAKAQIEAAEVEAKEFDGRAIHGGSGVLDPSSGETREAWAQAGASKASVVRIAKVASERIGLGLEGGFSSASFKETSPRHRSMLSNGALAGLIDPSKADLDPRIGPMTREGLLQKQARGLVDKLAVKRSKLVGIHRVDSDDPLPFSRMELALLDADGQRRDTDVAHACARGDADRLRRILASQPRLADVASPGVPTLPLALAILADSLPCVEALLAAGANPEATDALGRVSSDAALGIGSEPVLRALAAARTRSYASRSDALAPMQAQVGSKLS